MPQMKPMLWLFILIMTLATLFMMMILIYFNDLDIMNMKNKDLGTKRILDNILKDMLHKLIKIWNMQNIVKEMKLKKKTMKKW